MTVVATAHPVDEVLHSLFARINNIGRVQSVEFRDLAGYTHALQDLNRPMDELTDGQLIARPDSLLSQFVCLGQAAGQSDQLGLKAVSGCFSMLAILALSEGVLSNSPKKYVRGLQDTAFLMFAAEISAPTNVQGQVDPMHRVALDNIAGVIRTMGGRNWERFAVASYDMMRATTTRLRYAAPSRSFDALRSPALQTIDTLKQPMLTAIGNVQRHFEKAKAGLE